MTTLRVRHRTSYTYDKPVEFGIHSWFGHGTDMTCVCSGRNLAVWPNADVRWAFDTFGNSVALLTFTNVSGELVIFSELTLRRYDYDARADRPARHTGPYRFLYEADMKPRSASTSRLC